MTSATRSEDAPSPSRRWLDGLRADGDLREATLRDLHALLLRAAHREVRRRRHWAPGLAAPDLDVLAGEVADDALMDITNKLDDFRGESRFTTWAYAFVILKAAARLAREARRPLPATMDETDWEQLPDRVSANPHQRAQNREMLRALRHSIEHDLTERQRTVFVAVALNDAAPDHVAAQLGSTRNAIYKALFDARRAVRAGLQAAGYPVAEGRASSPAG